MLRRRFSPRGCAWLVMGTIALFLAPEVMAQQPTNGPSVLFCTPTGRGKNLDLTLLKRLARMGFEPDYLDLHADFSWRRIKQYDVLVVFGVPAQGRERSAAFPPRPPRRDKYVKLLRRYMKAGGGVFFMPYVFNGDEHIRALLEPMGARIPLEHFREEDPAKLARMPRMSTRGHVRLALTRQIANSPISAGVRRLWLPYVDRYNASHTAPIQVSASWQVVARGSPTSHTKPVEIKEVMHTQPPDDPLVREGGVEEPALIALREYKGGRIVLSPQYPPYSLGQGTKWLYNDRVLKKGFGGVPSDFQRLAVNAFRWLAAPARESDEVGGFTTPPDRLRPQNHRPEAWAHYGKTFWNPKAATRRRDPLHNTEIFAGLVGARTARSGGKGTVPDYATAARKAGLGFVVFLEDFARLTEKELRRLGRQCKEHSGDGLLLLPGYRIPTNTHNKMFFFGHDLPWTGKQYRTGENHHVFAVEATNAKGEYTGRADSLNFILQKHDRSDRGHHVGYYDFRHPNAQKIPDVRAASGAGIHFYKHNERIEDATDQYLRSAWGTVPPTPFAIHLVDSPQALRAAASADRGLTYAEARAAEKLMPDALKRSHSLSGMNVFPSTGPRIEAWPGHERITTFAAERFATAKMDMAARVRVRSEVGLEQVTIHKGDAVFRRFRLDGAQVFDRTLYLPRNIQRTYVLTAQDQEGGRAVSFARKTWKRNALNVRFCGDRVNDCGQYGLLAKGPNQGKFQTHLYPVMPTSIAGYTWDGGPRGVNPAVSFQHNFPVIESHLGKEGRRKFNNEPVLEFADEQAVVARSVLREVFAEGIPVKNAWRTYGPIEESKLIRAVRRYTEFNRPVKRVVPAGFPDAIHGGAMVCHYEVTVTFQKDQKVKSLRLFHNGWTDDAPLMLTLGGKSRRARVLNLRQHRGKEIERRLEKGDWFGIYTPKTTNNTLFLNRGAPVILRARPGGNGTRFAVHAAVAGESVKAGASRRYALFSVNDPLNADWRGPERYTSVLEYLARPDGLEVMQGERADSLGFVTIETKGAAAEWKVGRPEVPVDLTLPIRIEGLNPNWSAGLYQIVGYTAGAYSDGRKVYSPVGFDFRGYAYASAYPHWADATHMRLGHPVVSDAKGVRIQATPRVKESGEYDWYVGVNNPTDAAITTTLRPGMDVRGLDFEPREIRLAPGGYRVIDGDE